LAAFQVADFNPDSGTIHVWTSKSGKGRHIVLNGEGAALFRSFVAGRQGDAVLLTKADGSPWKPAHQARPMAGACKRAGIKPPVSFHVLRARHLRRILAAYSRYYNETRTHLSLGKDAPSGRAIQRYGAIVTVPILSGLDHCYARI
jgi:transposase InsO family protein